MKSCLPSWKCNIKSKTWLRQSVHIYLKNSLAKFHPDLIWEDSALGFFEEQEEEDQQQQEEVE